MEGDNEDSLDLSHLTDQEQAAILEVLLRDSELRCREEDRVRDLKEKEADPVRLRTLSGKWFHEERNKRHRNKKQGCDIVHASIRSRRVKGKDLRLSGMFDGHKEESSASSFSSNPSPHIIRRTEGHKEVEDNEESHLHIAPVPIPRTKNQPQVPLDTTSHSPHTDLRHGRNGHGVNTEEHSDGHDGDTDSISSDMTEPDPLPLRPSSSVSSLQSGYTITGSMMSLFSTGEFGAVEVKGRIQFSLVYNTHKEELQVRVCRCEDLAPVHKSRSDPYVKAYLLPDKSSHSKKKTSVKKKALNPVYDQTLKYKVRVGDLQARTLNLSVWHAESMGRNVFLGEVELLLGLWDWTNIQPHWHDLQPRIQLSPDSVSSRGSLLLSIKFSPAGSEGAGLPLTGELHIWLREAQGLLSPKGSAVDSFVKSYVLPDASRSSGQRTRTVKRSISPTYNHTMVYDGFQSNDLKEACTELTVWLRDGLKKLRLGGVRLSLGTGQSYGTSVTWMDSTEDEISVWTSMMAHPNHWIDTILPIRTNLTQRIE